MRNAAFLQGARPAEREKTSQALGHLELATQGATANLWPRQTRQYTDAIRLAPCLEDPC